jgi:hypothetical protein
MGLRHAVFASGIGGRSLDWANRSLAGDATLKLSAYFFCAALLHRISAAAHDQHPCDQEQDRHAYHLLILESRRSIARALDR